MWGVRGRAPSHPRPLVLSGVRPGPSTQLLWVRGVRPWGPVTDPTACAPASWLCALWGQHEGPRGGRLLSGCGASGVGRPPTPDHSSFRACGRGPVLSGCGWGGCGCGDPSPAPQRALLRAGFARCGGSLWVPGGGASCLGVGRPGLGALPSPSTRPFRACRRGPLPTRCGCGGCGRGDPSPTPQRAFLRAAFARCGGGMRVPGRDASSLGVGSPGRALSRPRPLVLSGVQPGPTTHWLWVRGVRELGPITNPTARALASWLCALWGRREGARGGRLLPGCGASGVRRPPTPDHSSFRACGRGPVLSGCWCGGCGRGDPSPTHQRALLRARFARCGGGVKVPGGGASCLGVGRPGSGALPPPTTRPFGRAAGAQYSVAVGGGGAAVGTRHQPHSARSCELALRAVGAACGSPGGAPLAWVWGVRGWALSRPRALVLFGHAARAHYPPAVGVGGVGVGTPHQPHSAHFCGLPLRAVGAA